MSRIVVVLWLGTATSRADAEPELDSWARARLVQIEDARAAPNATPDYDEAVVRRIEELLERARVAADALDEATSLSHLVEASGFIEKYPELPQAAWLSAERMLIEATLRDRQPDGSGKAQELRRAARVLEGERVAPLTEAARPNTVPPPEPVQQSQPLVPVRIKGLHAKDQVFWNGRLTSAPIEAKSGPSHHVRVIRQGRAVWAGWTSIPEAGGALTLGVPVPEHCSLDELGSSTIRDGRIFASSTTRCRSWAVARPLAGRGIEVATCTGNRCGPLLPWRRGDGAEFAGPPQPAPDRSTPAWLFVAAGIGAAALTSALLWQVGVFDEPEPAQDRVLFNGPVRR